MVLSAIEVRDTVKTLVICTIVTVVTKLLVGVVDVVQSPIDVAADGQNRHLWSIEGDKEIVFRWCGSGAERKRPRGACVSVFSRSHFPFLDKLLLWHVIFASGITTGVVLEVLPNPICAHTQEKASSTKNQ